MPRFLRASAASREPNRPLTAHRPLTGRPDPWDPKRMQRFVRNSCPVQLYPKVHLVDWNFRFSEPHSTLVLRGKVVHPVPKHCTVVEIGDVKILS